MVKAEDRTLTDGLVPVARFEDLESAKEYALVVLAMNLDCLITVAEEGYLIHAGEAFQEAVREEFRLYAEEQKSLPEPAAVPVFGSGLNVALVWISTLLFCFANQLEHPAVTERYRSSTLGIWEGGEWYRAFTSLFLHADLKHLMGNLVFGTLFGIFTAASFGPLRGWLLVLLSGLAGNLLSSGIRYPEEAYSLGASTAVFGALGLLMGAGLRDVWRERSIRPGMRAVAPLLAGAMIFSLNGIGGPETNTLSHFTGMMAGLFIGLPVALTLGKRVAAEK